MGKKEKKRKKRKRKRKKRKQKKKGRQGDWEEPPWKHTYEEFKELVDMPLEDKITRAEQLILYNLKDADNPMVSCSWGKDSMVVLHMVRKFCENVAVCFHNTKVQYPETYKFRDRMLDKWDLHDQYYETEPIMDFWECVERYGHPEFRSMDNKKVKCCYKLKEKPAQKFIKRHNIDREFLGLQATESNMRRVLFLHYGEVHDSRKYGTRIVRPIMIWTDEDVWKYHKKHDIPYNPLYKKMDRTGCMMCSGFKNWQKVMKKYNPAMYKIVKRQRIAKGQDDPEEYEKFENGESDEQEDESKEINKDFDKDCFSDE